MKKTDQIPKNMRSMLILLFLFLLHINTGFSQTKIDDYLTISFPGKVEKYDTVTTNASVSGRYFNTSDESFVLLRMAVLSDGKEMNILPSDSTELRTIYSRTINQQIKSMRRKGFGFGDSTKTIKQNYLGYNVSYVDTLTGIQNAESFILFLNGITYVATYSKVDTFVTANKAKFFKSLHVSDSQYQIEKATSFKIVKIVLDGILVIGIVIYFWRKSKQGSSIGFNLKRVYCPICQTKQPIIRMPKSQREALWGGTTCPKCQTRLDKYGNLISEDN